MLEIGPVARVLGAAWHRSGAQPSAPGCPDTLRIAVFPGREREEAGPHCAIALAEPPPPERRKSRGLGRGVKGGLGIPGHRQPEARSVGAEMWLKGHAPDLLGVH